MLAELVYKLFGDKGVEFLFNHLMNPSNMMFGMVVISLLIRVGLLVLVVILLVKGIKYLNKKNKE